MRATFVWSFVALLVALVVLAQVDVIEETDLQRDWKHADTMVSGDDPYQYQRPRTPGAMVLQLPLVLAGHEGTRAVGVVLAAVGLVGIGYSAVRIGGWSPTLIPVVVVALSPTYPVVTSAQGGNLGLFVSGMVAVAWASGRLGVLVGLVAALKLYPLLFVVAFWLVGRRRVAAWAVGSFAGVNAVGWLWIRPDVGSVWAAFRSSSERMFGHPGNGSVASNLGRVGVGEGAAVAVLLLMAGVWVMWRRRDLALPVAASVAVLVPTISWAGYHMLSLVALAWVAHHSPRVALGVAVVVAPLLFHWPPQMVGGLEAMLISFLILLAVIWSRSDQVDGGVSDLEVGVQRPAESVAG